ncbi:MAG: glutamate--tRNA ligase [Candidatus Kapabacteria bacterium]|jgi:glutamyl-tRNA synthetase|nr:glutamate--tRNA ligase [Candidatus Kapabacteria bacterium]
MDVRVRFAPSPTGFLHIGSLRTALYNFLFARHHGGVMILRVEDTDRTRLVEGAMDEQIASLAWAGVTFDEGPHVGGAYGPYVQSERFDLYREHAQVLLANGTAYYAFDTAEELDAMRTRQQAAGIAPRYDRSAMRNQFTLGEAETQRLLDDGAPHVVRLLVPLTREVRFTDMVRGDVVVAGREIDDQILLKSDGFPTYHLANVVDDHLMRISHVIRAEEWLPSTPKHVLLYEAFGWAPPIFAHVPLLLNPDRSKMSKRHGDVMVRDFRARGYFPDALVNFVALCGWNPGSTGEFFSMEELIQHFALERVQKAGAIFDYKKLDWMNAQYLTSKDPAQLADVLLPLLQERGHAYIERDYVAAAIKLLRERVTFLADIAEFGDYIFGDTLATLASDVAQGLRENSALRKACEHIRAHLDLSSAESFKTCASEAAAAGGLKPGQFMKPLRMVLTHREVGADLYETLTLIGTERCLARLDAYLA